MALTSRDAVLRLVSLTAVATLALTVAFTTSTQDVALGTHNVVHGKVFVLDAGHGTPCAGTYGRWTGQQEHDQNWQVAHAAKNYLENLGAIVHFTKSAVTDCPTDQQRADFVNAIRPNAFVSIHRNGHTDPTIRGIETFYGFSNLAIYVQNAVTAEWQWPPLGAPPVKERCASVALPCAVSPTPSALVEIGFMTNQIEDLDHATWADWQKSGLGVANGIYNFCLYNGC